ncbi:alcohol dehydrogenase-like regulatory protein ErcA [Telmatospirillum sp.]|uniref:alcohol dehydrogenase-like regulatory protein ErcA n=1 Tax=Telmatospirillum sp. TaxID=2079197 RepID=UPI002842ECEA|nr:alcohol dehydrogenase-like regulatory protein ErcA [Telmatospirillum sp.]MDR3435150.1 iron-containing alcohol dehydrogenase [Telmatospirillum sp.]
MALFEMRKFVAPEFIFGVGARHRAAFYAKNLAAKRVFVVTDPGVVAAGWLDGLLADLDQEGIDATVFQGVTPNPKDYEVMAGAEAYRQAGSDVLIALGGGSVIDCAKGIGIVATNQGQISDFEGVDAIALPGPPLICIPTTAGSAADISQFAIIVDTPRRTKIAIISKTVVPDVALVDPETTLTMDPYLTACTGLDALTHAIEAFVSTASSPVVDVHALAGITGVQQNLLTAVGNPGDLEAREKMMLASLQAGLAFSNASLGAVHAMSHSIGGFLGLPHGETNALLLEHVIDFNYPAAEARFQKIGEALGVPMRGRRPADGRRAILEEVRRLRTAAGIENGLASRGLRSDALHELSENAIRDACIYTNPRRINVADIEVIYAESL